LPKLNSFHCIHIDQYIRERNVLLKMIIHQHVNSNKVKDMSSSEFKRKKKSDYFSEAQKIK